MANLIFCFRERVKQSNSVIVFSVLIIRLAGVAMPPSIRHRPTVGLFLDRK